MHFAELVAYRQFALAFVCSMIIYHQNEALVFERRQNVVLDVPHEGHVVRTFR